VAAAPEAAVDAPHVNDPRQIDVAAAGAAPAEAEPATLEGGDEGPVLLGFGTERMAPGVDLPFPCKRALCITADLGTCPVVDRLRGAGVEVMALHAGAVASMKTSEVELALRDQDTVVYLAHRDLMGLEGDGTRLAQAVREQTSLLFGVFKALAPVLARRQVRVLVPLTMDGAFGAAGGLPLPLLGSFPAGFVRALARELPACRFQLIDTGALPWSDAVEQRIDRLSPGLEVGLGPLGPCAPTLQRLGRVVRRGDLIRPGDLLLVTGGARGIVFECVAALAQVTGARLLLTGRTPMPEGRPDWLDATSETIDGVLRTLELERVRTQGLGLGAARRMTSQARSQWEVARNLARLDGLGVDARYEVCDVTDRRAFARLLERLSQRETVRGVVHGAGVQRGRLLADLVESEALATVGTKLDPVFTVLDSLKLGDLRVIVAFGSIAGVFGNAGQTDYALANDALGSLVQALGRRHPGLHAQTIHWTAWTGTGMVTPEEEKRFAEAGLVPLDVPRGVRLFLDAVLGAEQAQLAAFNVAAAFTESRAVSPFPLTPRPRARLVEPRPGQPTEVRFSLARDLWLEQHKVNGEPTVPGTFVTELFAQVANELGKGVHEVRFRRPMLVRERGLTVELVRADDTLLAVPRERPDLPAKALANLAFASCRLGPVEHEEPGYLAFKAKEQGALLAAAQEALASFYTTLDERFSHALATGPIFRGIQATRRFGDRFIALASLTDEAMAAMALPGHYLAHPILADMAVQVGAAWAMVEHDVMAIPWEIGSLRIFGESTERDVVVICRATELGPARSVMDVLVREPDGRPVFALMGLTLKAIAGHDRPEAVMAGVVRADGVEDAAAQRHRGSDAPTAETPKKKS
ncbi:MAG: SDR family NAD(P)-dependent oxidoreductase, partial [Pseudomonadota bacterium]